MNVASDEIPEGRLERRRSLNRDQPRSSQSSDEIPIVEIADDDSKSHLRPQPESRKKEGVSESIAEFTARVLDAAKYAEAAAEKAKDASSYAESASDDTRAIRAEVEDAVKIIRVAAKTISKVERTWAELYLPSAAAIVFFLALVVMAVLYIRKPPQKDSELDAKVEKLSENVAVLTKRPSTSPAVDLAPLTKKIDDLAQKQPPMPTVASDDIAKAISAALEKPAVVKALKDAVIIGSGGAGGLSPDQIKNLIVAALDSKEVHQKLAEAVNGLVDKKELNATVKNLQAQTEQLAKAKAEAEKAAKQVEDKYRVVLDQSAKASAADIAALRKEIERLTGLKPGPIAPDTTENMDVIVIATDSRAMPLKHYADAFKRLLDGLPRDSEEKRYRLGFYAALGGVLEPRVPLKGGKPTPRSFEFGDPSSDTVEELPDLGPKVLIEFSEMRVNRRCIVVTSAASTPPKPSGAGWARIEPVDIILVRHDPRPTDGRTIASWVDYCSGRRATLTILTAADPKVLTDSLAKQLLWLADPKNRR